MEVFKYFIVYSLIIAIIFNNPNVHDEMYGTYGQATTLMWSYTTVLISGIAYFNGLVGSDDFIEKKNTKRVILFGLYGLVLFWSISINYFYYERINKKQTPQYYYLYSGISSTLFLISISLLLFDSSITDISTKPYFNLYLYISLIMIFVSTFIQQIILENFSVDML